MDTPMFQLRERIRSNSADKQGHDSRSAIFQMPALQP